VLHGRAQLRPGSMLINFVDVGYRFCSIIFNDFNVDFLNNRDFGFDYFVLRAGSRVSGVMN
jgi:hypothetical protein